MLHPDQFSVNEAWIVFQLNDTPILTERDGSLDCLALMDAASCYIMSTEFVSATDGPTLPEIRRLMKTARSLKNRLPRTLLIARETAQPLFEREATRLKIGVVQVPATELDLFISDARQSFREHVRATIQ
jgi:hypothetical protein